MQIDHELIETLVLKEISGDISPSEAALLGNLLGSDARARELAEKIRNKVSVNEINSYLLANDKNVFTREIIEKIRQHKRRQIILRNISVSAAASLIIFAGLWYFSFNSKSDSLNTTVAANTPPSKEIILHLPDGREIQLDSTDQKLQAGGITVSTQSRTLAYSANKDASLAAENATLAVPTGKDYKIQLEDGSEVHLNAATKLRFPLAFNGQNREISIDGEAYIKVAPNTRKPFIVHLPKGTVEVLGTEFNINTYDSNMARVSLVMGAVRVKTSINTVLLKPGTQAVSTSNDIAISSFDADEVLAWREGIYYIDDANLKDLSAVLSRWYGCTVVVDTKEAAAQRFTGVLYRDKPVDLMLKSIQLTNSIQYSTDENGIIHIK